MNTSAQYIVLSEYYRLADLEQFKGQVKTGDLIPVPLFPIGNWKSAKYPKLDLTQELADEVIANFTARVLGTDPVIDSSGRHDSSAPAAAWTKRLSIEPTKDGGSLLVAWSELTDVGADDLNNGRYRYASVEIGSHVDNVSGTKTDNVYRGATFCNTPVLRIMPAVLDTAEAIAASEPLAVALSEITLSTPEDPGDHAEPIDGSSDDHSQSAKDEEGQNVALADGDAETKGSDSPMKTVALRLSLAEDASEETILAEVTKLAEHDAAETVRADAAEATLAETAKQAAVDAFAVKLDEKIAGGFIASGERETFVKLAGEQSPELAETLIEARTAKVIDLGEVGTDEPVTEYADAPVELAEKAKALIDAGKATDIVAAQDMVLAESPDLKVRLFAPTITEER